MKKITDTICKQKGCEIELIKEGQSIFLKIFFEPDSIWVDTSALPHSAYLCACFDGQSLIESECGETELDTRQFLNMDWLLNEWNGDPEIVAALEFQKANLEKELPRLKEKYGFFQKK